MGKRTVKHTSSSHFRFPPELVSLNSDATKSDYQFIPYPEVLQDSKVILIDKFFDKRVCDAVIQRASNSQIMEAFHQKASKYYAARMNDRFSTTDLDTAQKMWTKLRSCLQQDPSIFKELQFDRAKGLNPQLRLYRYEKGHYFGRHYDESVSVPQMGTTQWTLLVYLSGDAELVGGDTVFYSELGKTGISVHPSKGLALLHKHGDDCLLHEAQLVKKGIKWVLRSDVVF